MTSSREHIYDLRSLENYTFTDENGKDQGINVRHKVRELIDFIQDDDKLRDERKKAKKNKDKYIGMSSDAMGMRTSSSGGGGGGGGYNDWDSPSRYDRKNSYEDDYHYDGEREDSDVESSDPPSTRYVLFNNSVHRTLDKNQLNKKHTYFSRFCRRYRDKESARPKTPVSTTTRSTTPSEKKSTMNVTVNPKSLVTTQPTASNPSSTTAATSKPKVSKKIDMGAATNFGRDEIGINSPTHRNTHAEEDLFSSNNIPNDNSNDLLDDIFKTCHTSANSAIETVGKPTNNVGDDLFNPRDEETQEFGDFASAFGDTGCSEATNDQSAAPATVNESVKNEFADFSAFDSAAQTITSSTDNAASLLFAVNSDSPQTQNVTSNSNQPVGDLLSDLDGLSLNVSVPSGKFSSFHT